jgi:hypothetical protein
MMKAHFVPVSYLKGFASGNPKARYAKAYVIERRKVYPNPTAIRKICARTDYYTPIPAQDARLFSDQETVFGTILSKLAAGDTSVLIDITPQLWLLKLRNIAILENTSYRTCVLETGKNIKFPDRAVSVIQTQSPSRLITSDDPLLLIGEGSPENMCFVLPLTPEKLLVSVPEKYFAIVGNEATNADVELLNKLQCRQARRCVITRDAPTDPSRYQRNMPQEPHPATSGVITITKSAILNFISINAKGPDGLPSFLTVRG